MVLPVSTIAPLPGDVIEDYEILEKIGGNMGLVFRARHRLLHKEVALKLLPAEHITDSARLARFQRELRAMGQLQHPNLVTASDARVVGCWHLVAMELIDGTDLNRLVEKGPLPVAAACEIARQAALGLQHAHEHGLIHRDIKPSNLMLTRAGTIKVIDMGLALIQEEPTKQVTQPGFILGTLSYCAPEQFGDPSHVDIRADIYSLGCTLYHLLTGKTPYPERRTLAEIMQAQLHEPFPSLLDSRPDVPRNLDTVLARMTAKKSDARFATPNELVQALTPFARGGDLKQLATVPHTPAPVLDRKPQPKPTPLPVTPLPVPTQPTSGSKGDTPKPRRSPPPRRKEHWSRNPAVWAMLVLLGIATATFIGMIFSDPIIVLMDTTAKGGVYDEEDRQQGSSNTDKLSKFLNEVSPRLRAFPVSQDWTRDYEVVRERPDLVVVHRSVFFHTLNSQLGLTTNDPMFAVIYELNDKRLRDFMGYLGSEEPRTQFLVYSRGTDPKWLIDAVRKEWVRTLEARFPALKGRIETMVIPKGGDGTFKDLETQRTMLNLVTVMLQKRNWVNLATREPWIMLPLLGAGLGLILTYYGKKK